MIDEGFIEAMAVGAEPPLVDPVGTNYKEALEQARGILMHWEHADLVPVLVALIAKIQQQKSTIEMFEYNQNWRKRRP